MIMLVVIPEYRRIISMRHKTGTITLKSKGERHKPILPMNINMKKSQMKQQQKKNPKPTAAKPFQIGDKNTDLINRTGTIIRCLENIKLDSYFILYIKLNSKWIKM